MKLPDDFRDLLEEFDREKVEWVIIGGYAFAFHAQPRATKDLDIFIEGSEDNRARASRALAAYGAPNTVVEAVRALAESEVAYLGRPPLRIDILRAIDGVTPQALLANAVVASWDGQPVRVIGLDDLIANKRAAGRPRDLADVAMLEQVSAKLRG